MALDRGDITSKPWVIVGAGPVGSMTALLLAILFPNNKSIHVLDKRRIDTRGHTLAIHADAIKEMIDTLNKAAEQIKSLWNTFNDDEKDYYKTILDRIKATNAFLKTEFSGKFIRTNKISETLQAYCNAISDGNVHFHLDMEVTTDDLTKLSEESSSNSILNDANILIGADGAHSGVRKVIFGESSDDLRKDELSFLLEIKLELSSAEDTNKFLDKITHSFLPTLRSGKLHIWSQSEGTATLRIFIDKNIYEKLRGQKDEQGKLLGVFSNPFRRLIELPPDKDLQESIAKIILDVIDANNTVALDTIKITALPLSVYSADRVTTAHQGKIVFLLGDAAAGLILAQGVNNGITGAAAFAEALFRRHLTERFNRDQLTDYFRHEVFRKNQRFYLGKLIEFFDKNFSISIYKNDSTSAIAQRQKRIIEEYEKLQEAVFACSEKGSSAQTYKKNINKLRANFIKFLSTLEGCQNLEESTRSSKTGEFTEIMDGLFQLLHIPDLAKQFKPSELHECERAMFKRTNTKIGNATLTTEIINAVAKAHGFTMGSFSASSSLFDDDDQAVVDDDPKRHPLALALSELLKALKKFDLQQHPELGRWLFQIDRVYIRLVADSKNSYNVNNDDNREVLHACIVATTEYVTYIGERGLSAAVNFQKAAPRFVGNQLVDDIIAKGNYLFTRVRSFENQDPDTLITSISKCLFQCESSHDRRIKDTAMKYIDLYKKTESQSEHLVILYSLFSDKNENARLLGFTILDKMLHSKIMQQQMGVLREIDHQVMREVLQKMILQSVGTNQLEVFEAIAKSIAQMNSKDMTPIVRLTSMLGQFQKIKLLTPSVIVTSAIDGIRSYLNASSANSLTGIFFGSMRSFSSKDDENPQYLTCLKNDTLCMPAKLAIICTLLSPSQDKNLIMHLMNALSPSKDNYLDPKQMLEVIKNIATQGMSHEQLRVFNSVSKNLRFLLNKPQAFSAEVDKLNKLFAQKTATNAFAGTRSSVLR